MSDSQSPENRPKLPSLKKNRDMLDWVLHAIALNMPIRIAAKAFVDAFPNFDSTNSYTELELIEILKKRFYHLKYDARRPAYSEIKDKKAYLQKFLDCIPVTSPLVRLVDLEILRQDCMASWDTDPIKYGHLITKIQSHALKEMNALMPSDKRTGLPMPSGPAPWEQKNKEEGKEEGTSTKGGDPFGGALMGQIREDTEDVDS